MNEEHDALPVDVKVLAAVSGGLGALGAGSDTCHLEGGSHTSVL
jgi:hypothetical protein